MEPISSQQQKLDLPLTDREKRQRLMIWGGVFIVIVIMVIVYELTPTRIAEDTAVVVTPTETSSLLAASGFNVTTQLPGDVVMINNVSVTAPTWIVIYEDRNGKPGNILGAALVKPGDDARQLVSLLRGMVDGGKYYAALAPDNGDHIFDLHTDLPEVSSDGTILATPFTAQAASPWGND